MARVLFVCLLVCLLYQTAEAQRICVAFRFDDYSGISETPLDAAIFELFNKHRLPLTMGVVPYQVDPQVPELMHAAEAYGEALSPEKCLLLCQAVESGLVEPALHGLTHADLAGTGRPPSEFAGLPLPQQQARIAQGKQTLETILGRRVHVFIPPFNSYDRHTLTAVKLAGMDVFSGSMWGPGVAGASLHMVPATCSLTQLPKALQAARQSTWPQPVVVVLFHSYDFQEQEPQAAFSLPLLDRLLGETARLQDVAVMTMGQLTGQTN